MSICKEVLHKLQMQQCVQDCYGHDDRAAARPVRGVSEVVFEQAQYAKGDTFAMSAVADPIVESVNARTKRVCSCTCLCQWLPLQSKTMESFRHHTDLLQCQAD